MNGQIKSYVEEKGYGFIKGDNGKDYFFHKDNLRKPGDEKNIYDDVFVTFDESTTPKGYRAKSIIIMDEKDVITYIKPKKFHFTKSDQIRNHEIIESADWIFFASSSDSPELAQKKLLLRAHSMNANAIVECEYFKTTESEDNYNYTVHNYRGRPVTIARKNASGTSKKGDLIGLNALINEKINEANIKDTLDYEKAENNS